MKLKHRITGTILAIAFATTTALPAATIPNLKSPPKAVAKVPSAPAAPRIPVAPRIVNVPKVPTVKVPVTPRIVAAPKIPVVKAAPKIPSTPKVVSTPKVPVVKAPVIVKAPAAAPKVVKSPVTAPSRPVANLKVNPKDIRKVVNEALNTPLITRSQDFATLPSRDLPGSNKPNLKPTSPGTPSLDGFTGTTIPTASDREGVLPMTPSEGKPAFDQGFGDGPQINEADVAAALNLNPLKGEKGGHASDGPLGGSDIGGNPSKGPAGQGTALISDGDQDEPMPQGDADLAGDSADSYTDSNGNTVVVNEDGSITTQYSDNTSVITPVDGDDIVVTSKITTRPMDGTRVSDDGRSMTIPDGEGGRKVFRDYKLVGTIDKDGNIKPSAGQPNPDNPDGGHAVLSAVITQQLKQAKGGRKGSQGGGADVMPGNESLTGGTARIPGAKVPQNKNGMLGNPGKDGGAAQGERTPPPNPNGDGNVIDPNRGDN